MKQQPSAGIKSFALLFISFYLASTIQAQRMTKIDWAKDTISRADAIAAKNTYLNTIRGSGQRNATQQINLPVEKLKEIIDACASSNVSDVAVMIITLRQNDIAHYRKNNPSSEASDNDLKGGQMLVFKIPRMAFADAAKAKVNLSGNPSLAASLLSAGLVQLKEGYQETPFASGYLYFSFGSICPPPTSCGDDEESF